MTREHGFSFEPSIGIMTQNKMKFEWSKKKALEMYIMMRVRT